ncbi:hypothetical protein V2E24_00860 [Mycoplasmopsis ciconiae]|uniref:Membrane nuclease MnuA n=1 Tax=Mycoplasmopsis ciconiae TaxID=561067 RepID=A0ABU7MM54_9BACT|nr:hypothetical protein [Mycoplasmopsis ciconiae]
MKKTNRTTTKNKKNKKIIKSIVSTGLSLIILSTAATGGIYAYKNGYFNKNNAADIVSTKITYKDNNYLNVVHWNILNYGGKTSNKEGLKTQAISKILASTNAEVIGLTEINYNDFNKVNRIVDVLNQMSKREYKFTVQSQKDAVSKLFPNSKEVVAIIYDSNVLDLVDNSTYQNQITLENNQKSELVRPFYTSTFKIKNTQIQFSTVFGHLDSPGFDVPKKDIPAKEAKSQWSEQGVQEVAEAKEISNALLYLKKKFPNNAAYLFGGDTNIMTKNHLKLANYIRSSSNDLIKDYFEYNQNNVKETSLSRTKNNYSNAYDKWFFINNNSDFQFLTYTKALKEVENALPFRYDLWNLFEDKEMDFSRDVAKKLYLQKEDAKENPSDVNLIRDGISDHTLINIYSNYKITKRSENK